MAKYRNKPVVIEALQWDGTYDGALQIREQFPEMKQEGVCNADGFLTKWVVKTLEGQHIVSSGDFIIKGVKGEFYPCKPDIFALTYEEMQ